MIEPAIIRMGNPNVSNGSVSIITSRSTFIIVEERSGQGPRREDADWLTKSGVCECEPNWSENIEPTQTVLFLIVMILPDGSVRTEVRF